MSRHLLLVAALSLVSLGLSDRATAIEPDYPCYVRTSSGRMMNLGKLCDGPVGSFQLAPQSASGFDRGRPLLRPNFDALKVREGREARQSDGQYFSYEVVTDQANSSFRLKYGSEGSRLSLLPRPFATAQDAVDYFECNIVNKATAACPKRVTPPTAR
jgi:hypothetical protein